MRATRQKRLAEHVVMIPGGGIGCAHCGAAQDVPYPIAIPVFVAIEKAFRGMHKACKKGPGGAARFAYTSPAEWRRSWDTGISALTIYHVLEGGPKPQGVPGVPRDPDDFGRCHRLLKVVPGWRAQLGRVAERYPERRGLVDRWDELERLYEEELPTGRAPRLFALMEEVAHARA